MTASVYVENMLPEENYGFLRRIVTAHICLQLKGIVLSFYQTSLQGGTIYSPNGRFELQLDKMATEGILLYDNELGRAVRSYAERRLVQLALFSYALVGTTVSTMKLSLKSFN